MEYVLTTDHLCKNYGHLKALNQCSMHVPRGAIYGFVGKNGAGKTTSLELCCEKFTNIFHSHGTGNCYS